MLGGLLILAFGFVNLAMLGWLAAAGLPVLIHLWSRRRYRETSWAAMEYLLAAVKRARRRLQFEQWLLLAIRTLIVMLIVLAAAEPFFELSGLAFVPGRRSHRVLVLDGSYSMDFTPTDKTRFEQAKQLAGRIVRESPQGDGFTLVLMSQPPRVVVGTPVFDRDGLLEEIDLLELPHTGADVPATFARIEEILTSARREEPRLVAEAVYFLTDLGRVGWASDGADSGESADLVKRAKRLARSAALVVIDLGQEAAENVALTELYTPEPFATPARPVSVQAKIRNFGRQRRNRQVVEFLIDGRRVKQETIDLAPGGQATVGFSHRFEAPGDHAVEVRLSGDRLDVDNHRWLALEVKPSLSVLCVDGRPSGEWYGGACDFLEVALSPGGSRAGRLPVEPEVTPESGLVELDLETYDCVFLADVAQFTSNEAEILDAYLERGGSLVFFLGGRVLADSYNRQLAGGSEGAVNLLPARLGKRIDEPQFRLDPLGYRHPIVEAFRGREQSGLLRTPVNRYFELIVPERSGTRVALAMENGDPLIVEAPVHRGRVILVATSADASWTPLPIWPSYVPVIHEILAYAVAGRLRGRTLEVGQPLGDTLWDSAGGSTLRMTLPGGEVRELQLQSEEDATVWSFAETTTSGTYTARFGSPISRSETFAVNVDTAESDLTKLSPEELQNEVLPGVSFVHQTSWESADGEAVARMIPRSRLPKGLLYLVLGLLFAETYLARRFGHHTE